MDIVELVQGTPTPVEDTVVITEGNSTTLRCSATGADLPMERLIWTYPGGTGNVDQLDAIVSYGIASFLTIEAATQENAGEYICADSTESVTDSVTLTVE